MAESEVDWETLDIQVGQVFTPNTPINHKTLFSGRIDQVRRIVDAVHQPGQHVMLFGERGVGKTSLANVVSQFRTAEGSGTSVVAPRINCDSSDDFSSVWRKVFEQIDLIRSRIPVGFTSAPRMSAFSAADLLPDVGVITTDDVRRVASSVGASAPTILIIDEFDRLKPAVRRMFGDLIKTLSDHAVAATVVLVGVAESIDDLIEGHESVSRAIVQVQMPRMQPSEIEEILETGAKHLGFTFDSDARARVVLLAQGLPHYTHLVALHAARAAVDRKSRRISMDCVNMAIKKAIADAQHTIQQAYHDAIRSPQKGNLFADVLLSCALAEQNQIGEFSAPAVREAMAKVTGKNYEIPSFAQHLKEFSERKRGHILRKLGQTRRFRYRFSDPLMQPYVIMQGLATERIGDNVLSTS